MLFRHMTKERLKEIIEGDYSAHNKIGAELELINRGELK